MKLTIIHINIMKWRKMTNFSLYFAILWRIRVALNQTNELLTNLDAPWFNELPMAHNQMRVDS